MSQQPVPDGNQHESQNQTLKPEPKILVEPVQTVKKDEAPNVEHQGARSDEAPINDTPIPPIVPPRNPPVITDADMHLRDQIRWTDGAIVFLTVGLVVASFLQWHAMKGQLDEMKGSGVQTTQLINLYQQQLDQVRKQAGDTQRLAQQAEVQSGNTDKLAKAALGQLGVMQAQLENQRPIIVIPNGEVLRNAQITVKAGNPPKQILTFSINVRNNGVSLARLGESPRFSIERLGKGEVRFWKEDLCKNQPNIGPRFLVPMGQNVESLVYGTVDKPLLPDEPPSIDSRVKWTYLSGCITYFGPANDRHWLKFVFLVGFDAAVVKSNDGIRYNPVNYTALADQVGDTYNFIPR
jgi:hypothetical protein